MSRTVNRTLDLFELFAAQQRPLTLSDMSRMLDIPVSSCHDVLRTLEERGYLYQVSQRAGFYPTRRFTELAEVITSHDPIVTRAEDVLRGLREELDESLALAKETSPGKLVYLLSLEPSHPLRYTMRVGNPVRIMYATSGGRAYLGSLPPASRAKRVAAMSRDALTDHTVTDTARILEIIEDGNQRGWFINRGETVEGVTTVSARFRHNGTLFVITIAGPQARIERNLDQISARLLESCAALGDPPDPSRGETSPVGTPVRAAGQ